MKKFSRPIWTVYSVGHMQIGLVWNHPAGPLWLRFIFPFHPTLGRVFVVDLKLDQPPFMSLINIRGVCINLLSLIHLELTH